VTDEDLWIKAFDAYLAAFIGGEKTRWAYNGDESVAALTSCAASTADLYLKEFRRRRKNGLFEPLAGGGPRK